MPPSLLKAALLALALASSTPAPGQSLVILDPAGGDKGPGTYRDGDCDPHVIGMLMPEGQDQYAVLKDYACGPDGEAERLAVLPMILPGS